jgi:hypothetical protein
VAPYEWSQTLKEVTLSLPLPEGCGKRNVAVTFKPDRLKVVLKGNTVVDGELHKRVKVDDSTWYLEGGKLRIDLSKAKGDEWWKARRVICRCSRFSQSSRAGGVRWRSGD